MLLTATWVCAAPPEATIDQMQTISGRLYLNDRELKAIYEEMHGYAQFTPGGPDRQLDYIQKLYLIIGRSRTHGYYLWRFLSIFDYLDEARKNDFLTLYEAELRQARDDVRLSIQLIDLYSAFIEKEEIRKTAARAEGILEANVYMYEKLAALIAPYVNPALPPRRIE